MSNDNPPFWRPDIHADRRPALLVRGRIKTALRRWFEAQGFIEVEAAILQLSPGNETHLHGFATTLIDDGGAGHPYYLHTSPEFAAKKLLAAGEPASSISPASSVIASAPLCTIPSSPCWNGTAPGRIMGR